MKNVIVHTSVDTPPDRFEADNFEMDVGRVLIFAGGNVVAAIAAGHWTSVRIVDAKAVE